MMAIKSIGLKDFQKIFGKDLGYSLVPVPLELKWGSLSAKHELEVLAHLCRLKRPKAVFEFGTFEGLTTLLFALNSPQATVWTLDLPRDKRIALKFDIGPLNKRCVRNRGQLFFQDAPCRDRIKSLFGDSATFDYSPFEGKMDLIFVDGAHTVYYTRNDSDNAFRMVRKGGIIVWHDYNPRYWPDTVKYLRELSRSKTLYHVKDTYLVFWMDR